jgi:ketosteroid isomerase-like protein
LQTLERDRWNRPDKQLLNRLCVLGIAALVTLVLAPRAVADAVGQTSSIDAFYQNFTTAFRNKDLDGIMALYVHNDSLFVFDMSPPREYIGWAAYRADWRTLFASFKGPIKFSIVELGIATSGHVAYTHSLQRIAGLSSDGKPVHLVVRVTDVLRKLGNRWLIVQEHVSVPVDPDSGVADWDSK